MHTNKLRLFPFVFIRVHTWLLLFTLSLNAQLTPEQKRLNTESFEKVWTTIRDKHWEKNPGGLDWQAIHDEYRPQIDKADSMEAARKVMRDMLDRLKETHFGILPSATYGEVSDPDEGGAGSTGIELRVLGHQAIVTRLDPGSPAEKAGVKTGWAVVNARGKDLAPVIEKLQSTSIIPELQLERVVESRVTGPIGGKINIVFLDGANKNVPLNLDLAMPRGELTRFGNLPPEFVWIETRKIGEIGYVRFNLFLDLIRVMSKFSSTVSDCMKCEGLIIDLRGNPGGIGGMAMGMAGWFVDKSDQRLGTMVMRENKLNFVVNPRPEVFHGPVAILMDGSSASTSEIFAEGLKDLGLARVFGTRSAAAALPSIIERLPNGDGFQYAMANYISEGGQALEGHGVTPDQEVKLTREALLSGHDSVIDAAIQWIKQRTQK
jgi:carboxyl-terminal processing protease